MKVPDFETDVGNFLSAMDAALNDARRNRREGFSTERALWHCAWTFMAEYFGPELALEMLDRFKEAAGST